jgi:hypothetical protein
MSGNPASGRTGSRETETEELRGKVAYKGFFYHAASRERERERETEREREREVLWTIKR